MKHDLGGVPFVISPMDARRVGDFVVETLGGALVVTQVFGGPDTCSIE